MNLEQLEPLSPLSWRLPATGAMRVPGIFYGDRALLEAMDDKVMDQLRGVASLPGIIGNAWAMPDAHWGYGFPIGGVAAFDPERGGVISAGGVGFDISCGVRTLLSDLRADELAPAAHRLADELAAAIPAGLGSQGGVHMSARAMDDMLTGGAAWAVQAGFGEAADLHRCEERGRIAGANPDCVSDRAKQRQRHEMGTLGSGNHYLEVQQVAEIFDRAAAASYGLTKDQVVISIHCGSRGLGHQIGTEFLEQMLRAAPDFGIDLPDRELACAPIRSSLGERYLGAMRAGINCALANRQILTQLTRRVFAAVLPGSRLDLLYDVSHNTCKAERHKVGGHERELFVHRKGATRALGPGHPDLPAALRETGQPVLVGGSMGTGSYILAGTACAEGAALSSSCHGAGRAMSRRQAGRRWQGREVVSELRTRGILIRAPSMRGVAEEAPEAYKDVTAVVEAADGAGLSRKVARLRPLICIKG